MVRELGNARLMYEHKVFLRRWKEKGFQALTLFSPSGYIIDSKCLPVSLMEIVVMWLNISRDIAGRDHLVNMKSFNIMICLSSYCAWLQGPAALENNQFEQLIAQLC